MKKKLLVLLSSVVAGVSLVGATFAAWAITDNADPLGIKISPSGIEESTDTYSTMTLEWGTKSAFTNIANLDLGEERVVSVGVKSTVSAIPGDDESGGNLALSLEDYTTNHVDGAPKLIDNLEIYAYDSITGTGPYVKGEEYTGLRMINGAKTANQNITTPVNGNEKVIYFTVKIKDSVTSAQLNQMKSDVVYLFADWGKPNPISEVSVRTLYFKADADHLSESGIPYAYAYKETTVNNEKVIKKNANWPGVQMSVYNTANHIYSIDIEVNKFENIIFSYGAGAAYQTADLDIPAANSGTLLYDHTLQTPNWVNNTYSKDVQDPVYYLVGNMTGWDTQEAYKLTGAVDGVYSFDITVPEGGLVYKVKETTTNTWYDYTQTGTNDNCTWNNAGDLITIKFSPTKSLNEGQNYITADLKQS